MDVFEKKILIVDDEPDLRRSLRYHLEDRGCRVFEAENGYDAIEKFKEHLPDTALVDLKMPGMSGLELIRILHRKYPFIPLVVISGTGIIEHAMEAMRNGAWDYISKPVIDMAVLDNLLKRVSYKASLLSENKRYQHQLESLVKERTSELNRAVKEISEINDRLHSVVETTCSLQGFDRIESFGKFLLEAFVMHMKAGSGSFYLCEKDGLKLIDSMGCIGKVIFIPYPLDEDSVLKKALDGGVPLISDIDGPLGSSIVFPLTDKDRNNVGVLTLSRSESPFGEQDKEIGSILSSFSSEAIRAISFIRDIKKREKYFRILAKGIGGSSDREFYLSIVRSCVSIFETEYSLLGRIEEGKLISVAYIENGKFSEIETDIKENLISKILRDGSYIYSENMDGIEAPLVFNGVELKSFIGVAIKDSSGEVCGILSTFSSYEIAFPEYWMEILALMASKYTSVTDLIKADFEQEKLRENLRQAQKMEAIGTLAGGIAHDFNNILSPILGYSEMLLFSIEDSSVRDDLERIKEAGLRAKELVQQILAFSRQKGVKAKPFDVHIIVREVLRMLKSTIPATIKIESNIEKNCHPVYADPTQIHQVIMNLCTNAFHAMEEDGGVLTVITENTEIFEPYKGYSNYVLVKVKDTGTGMKPELVERIFEPYFTTKTEGKGTGLGLSVAHGIVSSCGGFIDIETKPGKGTTFSVYLPVVSEYQKETKPEKETGILGGFERIMIVDDQIPILTVLENLLASIGYNVTSFDNPIDALERYKEAPHEFDLLITDQTMPEMTGDKLAEKIFEIDRKFPIILCTGYSSVMTRKKALDLGIREYLSKPIEMYEIASAVRSVLDN